MERHGALSPVPRVSTFHFPWSTGEHPYHQTDLSIKTEEGGYEEASPDTNVEAEVFTSVDSFPRIQAPQELAMHLLRDSWSIFKDLRLEDWVKYVLGMPCTAISLFEAYHRKLGLSIYSFLQKSPADGVMFQKVAKSIQPIDRFLYTTISHALLAVESERPCHKPSAMDADHITGPLKKLLGEPDKAIIRRLKILESRYTRYRSGLDIAGGLMFQVNTDFFTALSEQTPTAIAWKMTQVALEVFSKISIHGLMHHDDHLRQLAVQWDQINRNVEEIAAAGCLDDSLRDIAWNLHRLKNHFCLCAVLGGMAQAKLQIESTLTGFVDTRQNYRQYRLQLHIEPSLPFLYPFIVELRRGNRKVLKDIFNFFPYEQFLQTVKEDNIVHKDGKLRIRDLDS